MRYLKSNSHYTVALALMERWKKATIFFCVREDIKILNNCVCCRRWCCCYWCRYVRTASHNVFLLLLLLFISILLVNEIDIEKHAHLTFRRGFTYVYVVVVVGFFSLFLHLLTATLREPFGLIWNSFFLKSLEPPTIDRSIYRSFWWLCVCVCACESARTSNSIRKYINCMQYMRARYMKNYTGDSHTHTLHANERGERRASEKVQE